MAGSTMWFGYLTGKRGGAVAIRVRRNGELNNGDMARYGTRGPINPYYAVSAATVTEAKSKLDSGEFVTLTPANLDNAVPATGAPKGVSPVVAIAAVTPRTSAPADRTVTVDVVSDTDAPVAEVAPMTKAQIKAARKVARKVA